MPGLIGYAKRRQDGGLVGYAERRQTGGLVGYANRSVAPDQPPAPTPGLWDKFKNWTDPERLRQEDAARTRAWNEAPVPPMAATSPQDFVGPPAPRKEEGIGYQSELDQWHKTLAKPFRRFNEDIVQPAVTGFSEKFPHMPPPQNVRPEGYELALGEKTFQDLPNWAKIPAGVAYGAGQYAGGIGGFLAGLPQMALDPEEGQLEEEAKGLGQMFLNAPEQIMSASSGGLAQTPDFLAKTLAGLQGKTVEQYRKDAIMDLYKSGGTSPIFAAQIGHGAVTGAQGLAGVKPEIKGPKQTITAHPRGEKPMTFDLKRQWEVEPGETFSESPRSLMYPDSELRTVPETKQVEYRPPVEQPGGKKVLLPRDDAPTLPEKPPTVAESATVPTVKKSLTVAPDLIPDAGKMVKTEMTAAGEQVTFAPQREVPTTKLRKTGKKKVTAPINQGDLMQPDKLKVGNLPQDQVGLFDKLKAPTMGLKAPIKAPAAVKPLSKAVATTKARLKPSTKAKLEEYREFWSVPHYEDAHVPIFSREKYGTMSGEQVATRTSRINTAPDGLRGYDPKRMVKIIDKVLSGKKITPQMKRDLLVTSKVFARLKALEEVRMGTRKKFGGEAVRDARMKAFMKEFPEGMPFAIAATATAGLLSDDDSKPYLKAMAGMGLIAAKGTKLRRGKPFYSKLVETAKTKFTGRYVSVPSVKPALLKAGVKPDEIKWSGLDDYLKGKMRVKPEDLNKFLAENQVEVMEVVKGGEQPSIKLDVPTKWEEHQLPGGENYRELLLTKPPKGGARGFKGGHFDEPNVLAHVRFNDRKGPKGEKILFIEEVQSDWHQKGRAEGYRRTLTSSEQAELTTLKGRIKVLLEKLKDPTSDPRLGIEYSSIIKRIKELEDKPAGGGSKVPNAPFKKTWHELAMKRMLHYAAEKGYDKVAWTKGRQQIDRYEEMLRQNVDYINYDVDPAGEQGSGGLAASVYYVDAYKNGKPVHTADGVSRSEAVELLGKDIVQKMDKGVGEPTGKKLRPDEKRLADADLSIGGEGMKGFYDKMLPRFMDKHAKKWGAKTGEVGVSTIDLPATEYKIAGKWEDSHSFAGKRKVGDQVWNMELKVEEPITEIRTHYRPVPAHAIDITPEMREEVTTKGQALFGLGALAAGTAAASMLDDETKAKGVALAVMLPMVVNRGIRGRLREKLKDGRGDAFAEFMGLQHSYRLDPKAVRESLRKGERPADMFFESQAVPDVATRVTPKGKTVGIIRQKSHFAAPGELSKAALEKAGVRDAKPGWALSMDPGFAWKSMDNLSMEQKQKVKGQAGPIERLVGWRTQDAIMLRDKWKTVQTTHAREKILKNVKASKMKLLTRVGEQIGRKEVKLSLDDIMKLPAIAKLTNKRHIVQAAIDGRQFKNELIGMENEARALRGQKPIPFRDKYEPHKEKVQTLWGKAVGFGKEAADLIPLRKTGHMPDFVLPNAPYNPHAKARKMGLKEHMREMRYDVLLEQHIEAVARDIFNTGIIENNKIMATALNEAGYTNAAEMIQNYTAEVFAGKSAAIDRSWFLDRMPMIRKGAAKFRAARNRSIFGGNFVWSLTTQWTSAAFTVGEQGILNSAKALRESLGSKEMRKWALDTYVGQMKTAASGRVSQQDISSRSTGVVNLRKGFKPTMRNVAETASRFVSDTMERELTIWSILSGRRHGQQLGLTGKALEKYASDAGRSQGMYNVENLPGILRNESIKTLFPFQTFYFTALQYLKQTSGQAGVFPEKKLHRLGVAGRYLGAILATGLATRTIAGRDPWDIYMFMPIYGDLVRAIIQQKRVTSRNLPSPASQGYDLANALYDFVEKDRTDRLRKWLTTYGTGYLGIPGGVQLNRMVEGVMAVGQGGRHDAGGKKLYDIDTEWDKARAIVLGPGATSKGMEYSHKKYGDKWTWMQKQFDNDKSDVRF